MKVITYLEKKKKTLKITDLNKFDLILSLVYTSSDVLL